MSINDVHCHQSLAYSFLLTVNSVKIKGDAVAENLMVECRTFDLHCCVKNPIVLRLFSGDDFRSGPSAWIYLHTPFKPSTVISPQSPDSRLVDIGMFSALTNTPLIDWRTPPGKNK